jgi:hypothetical protein
MAQLPTTTHDCNTGSVRRRGAAGASDPLPQHSSSSRRRNNGVTGKNKEFDDKLRTFSRLQKIDWLLGWLPRQIKRFCTNLVILVQPIYTSLLQRWKWALGTAVILSLTVMMVGINGPSERRALQYHFQIVFPNATRHSGTKFRYPSRNVTVPVTFVHEGLDVVSLSATPEHPFQRIIQANDYDISDRQRSDALAVSDNQTIPYRYWHNEDLEGLQISCRRPAWTKLQFLNCNTFHEVSLSRDYQEEGSETRKKAPNYQDYDNYLVNHGYYRDVWVNSKPSEGTTAILKTTRFQFDFGWRNLFHVRQEAIIMERLTKFRNIVTSYGHCGTSVLTEALPHEVERYVVPGTGYKKQPDLHDELDVDPQNALTAKEKLETALAMAESIAVLHGFGGGVIVHDDIQLQQWLRAADGTLQLGDFNRATILDWNDNENRYCKYSNGEAFGNVSPWW